MGYNQRGDLVVEKTLFAYTGDTAPTEQDRNDAIALLCEHLGVSLKKTNATKRGHTEMVLIVNNPE